MLIHFVVVEGARLSADGNGNTRVIWVKTDAGRAEMQNRALVKERARRNLLLLIDGAKSEEMLLANLAGITAADFQELRKLDLIAPAAGAVTVGNPARAAASNGAAPADRAAAARAGQVARLQRVHRRADQAHLEPARPARLHADARGRQGVDDRGAARRRPARHRAGARAKGEAAAIEARKTLYGG